MNIKRYTAETLKEAMLDYYRAMRAIAENAVRFSYAWPVPVSQNVRGRCPAFEAQLTIRRLDATGLLREAFGNGSPACRHHDEINERFFSAYPKRVHDRVCENVQDEAEVDECWFCPIARCIKKSCCIGTPDARMYDATSWKELLSTISAEITFLESVNWDAGVYSLHAYLSGKFKEGE